MNESKLRMALTSKLRREFPPNVATIFRHENRMGAGMPDLSVTMNCLTSWWEIKYAHPRIIDTELQHLFMCRLEIQSTAAHYIVYSEVKDEKQTKIVRPSDLGQWTDKAILTFKGFAHDEVARVVKEIHRGNGSF